MLLNLKCRLEQFALENPFYKCWWKFKYSFFMIFQFHSSNVYFFPHFYEDNKNYDRRFKLTFALARNSKTFLGIYDDINFISPSLLACSYTTDVASQLPQWIKRYLILHHLSIVMFRGLKTFSCCFLNVHFCSHIESLALVLFPAQQALPRIFYPSMMALKICELIIFIKLCILSMFPPHIVSAMAGARGVPKRVKILLVLVRFNSFCASSVSLDDGNQFFRGNLGS